MSVISRIEESIQSPYFPDEEKYRTSQVLNILSIITILGISILLAFRIISGRHEIIIPLSAALAIMIFCRILLFGGAVEISSKMSLWTIFGLIIYFMLKFDGIHDSSVLAIPGILVASGLLLKKNYFYFFSATVLILIILLGYLEIYKVIKNGMSYQTNFGQVLDDTIILIITIISIRILSDGMINNIRKAKENENEIKKQAEKLKEINERYVTIFESANDAIFILRDDKYIDCNSKAVKMFGCSKDKIINESPVFFSPSVQSDGTESIIKANEEIQLALDGNPQRFEWRHKNINGKIFDTEVSLIKIEISGQVLLHAIVRDITERKIFEKKLRESEEKFRQLFQTSPNIIVISILEDGLIIDINDAGAGILGFEKKEMIGKTSIELGVARFEMREEMKRIMQQDKKFNLVEQTLYKKNGEPLTCLLSGQLLNIDNRTYLFQTIVDITKLKQSEEKLMLYQQRLKRLSAEINLAEERERRKIAINLHDHLTQSLAMTKIKLSEIQKEVLSDKITSQLNEVKNYLDESIQNSRKITYELSPPVLYELGLAEAVEWLLKQVEANNKIKTIYKSELGDYFIDNDDRILLFRSINELLNNSIKHSRCNQISVNLYIKEDIVFAEVKDDGIGFEPDKIANKYPAEGGFGLFSIKERLEYLNGSIDISSSPGRGTDIILSLSLKKNSLKKE